MSEDRHPIIAREGWGHVAVAVVLLAAGAAAWPPLAIPLGVLLVFVLQFFRDPKRAIPAQPGAVVAPADGRVIEVGPAQDPLLERPAQKISVFMNVFNVHANRIPAAGEIVAAKYTPGRFVNAALDKASAENEANALAVRTESAQEITFVQIAGLVARRIMSYVKTGDQVRRGQRYGFIRFGSRVDVYLPEDAEIRVAPGDRVSGGEDVLALLAGDRDG
ncbi:MAG: phosphatidylserine decarboxylase [Betaproteobacteria bacterium AqS2]|uniref:Phosphatidylserine decarboxylase proenzyme n=1 Tax=Candidatus Amphirhobacter heronislandensis TaxID=1732024 RepID=A0A930XW25_9GAMM|nr:phosphatidylserine decarboxylase [Betaproteobacteria bacterium AqS2]